MNKITKLTAAALLLTAGAASAATIASSNATIVSTGFVSMNGGGSTGNNNGNNFRAFAAFSVSDIIANEASISSIADFATASFAFSFDTTTESGLSAGSYTVEYVGFFANANLPNTGVNNPATDPANDWVGKFSAPTVQIIDTGIADTLALQTGITASGFTISGVTEADSANDAVMFRVRYDEPQASGTFNTLGNYSLSVIPEPSAALLGVFGFLFLLRRRR